LFYYIKGTLETYEIKTSYKMSQPNKDYVVIEMPEEQQPTPKAQPVKAQESTSSRNFLSKRVREYILLGLTLFTFVSLIVSLLFGKDKSSDTKQAETVKVLYKLASDPSGVNIGAIESVETGERKQDEQRPTKTNLQRSS
jgi:hypothetical protein